MERREAALFGTVGFIAVAGLILLFVGDPFRPADEEPGEAEGGGSSAHSLPGMAVFDGNCAQCHGEGAIGSERGPPLVHAIYEPGHHGDAAFRRAIRLGSPQHHWQFGDMPPVEGLTESEIEEIVAYVRALQRAAGIE